MPVMCAAMCPPPPPTHTHHHQHACAVRCRTAANGIAQQEPCLRACLRRTTACSRARPLLGPQSSAAGIQGWRKDSCWVPNNVLPVMNDAVGCRHRCSPPLALLNP
eukprot:365650-Chlamydomonas_euryale.AAC.9